MDRAWWRMYLREVKEKFQGELYSTASQAYGPQHINAGSLGNPGNSGAGAILLADYYGAQRGALLGFDCHKVGGSHHHGDHPKGLGNAGSLLKWPKQFREAAQRISGQWVNCSPGTRLEVWPTGDLSEFLDT